MDPYLEEERERPLEFRFLIRLWPFVRPYRSAFAVCLLILVASFALELIGPWLLRLAIDGPMRDTGGDPDARLTQLYWLAGGFVASTALAVWLGYSYGLLAAWNGQRVIRDVRARLFDHLLHRLHVTEHIDLS